MIRDALRAKGLLSDYSRIVTLVEPGSRVLDLGCGNGELLARLIQERGVRGMGVEIKPEAVVECIHKGLSVFQGNIDEGLADYGDASYDYVILNQTLQVIRHPAFVVEEMLRVGRRAIVSFPNFAHSHVRWQLLFRGRMPRTTKLPFEWFDTPNIHLVTIRDFEEFCKKRRIRILRKLALRSRIRREAKTVSFWPNLRADEGLFVLSQGK